METTPESLGWRDTNISANKRVGASGSPGSEHYVTEANGYGTRDAEACRTTAAASDPTQKPS